MENKSRLNINVLQKGRDVSNNSYRSPLSSDSGRTNSIRTALPTLIPFADSYMRK